MQDATFYLALQKDAEYIAEKASELLANMQKDATVAVQKDAVDLSTTADIAAEKLIVSFVLDKYPDHGIYSEEMGEKKGQSPYTWIIDPLDGTLEYARGSCNYSCLVGVEENGSLVAGVAKMNAFNQIYTCSKGSGAYIDNKQVHVSQTHMLSQAKVGVHFPSSKRPKEEIRRTLSVAQEIIFQAYRLRPYWNDATMFGMVAEGSVDAWVVSPSMPKWYDVAPVILLVEEAGGKVTDWEGNPLTNHDLSKGILVSNGKVHEKLLNIIKSF